jgi:hypothetical protein
MTDQSFDNFFKEKLKDHSAPVPKGLWEKINPEKEKKPMGFVLPKHTGKGLMVAAVITGALGIALNTGKSKNQASISIQPTPNQISNSINRISAPIITQKDNNTAVYTNHVSEDQISQSSPNLGTITTNSIKGSENAVIIGLQTASPSSFSNSEKYEKPKFAFSNNKVDSESFIPDYISNHENGKTVPLSNQSNFNQLGMVNKQLSANAHDKKMKSIIICPTIRGKSASFNTDWGMEIYASPDYAFKSVSNVNASAQYLNSKDSSEQMQVGYSAGIRLVKPLNDHFLLKTGLQYSQINQKFVYKSENEIKVTTVITARTIIRSPGDTIQVSDTSVLQTIGYSTKNVKNRYRSIDIPLTLGYEFGNDDLRIGINAGVIFNISSWYQGEMLDTAYQPVSISKASNSLFKTNIGMGLYSSISIQKRISDNTHLFFEPYFRYNLKNMTNDLSAYSQRFQVGGLAIGLRFNLNR